MGIISSIRKFLFGTARSNQPIKESSPDYDHRDHLLELKDDHLSNDRKIMETHNEESKGVIQNIKESELFKKSSEVLENVGDVVATTGEKFMGKAKDVLEGPGKEVLDKFGSASEKIGEKIVEGGKALKDKASEIMDSLGDKLDETMKKAEEFTKTQDKNDSEFAETEFKMKKSELDDKDDFFSKADKFSKGEYSNSDTRILDTKKTETTEKSKNIEGFDDADQDGDPLIDDAKIIEEENNEKKS